VQHRRLAAALTTARPTRTARPWACTGSTCSRWARGLTPKRIASLIPSAWLVVMASRGRWPEYEDTETFNKSTSTSSSAAG
jgi:hypothetical protein